MVNFRDDSEVKTILKNIANDLEFWANMIDAADEGSRKMFEYDYGQMTLKEFVLQIVEEKIGEYE
jgi:hypothetical protein